MHPAQGAPPARPPRAAGSALTSGDAPMNKFIIATAFAAAIALPAAGQSTTATANGQIPPTTSAAKVKVEVNQSLASTAKISGDSAFAIARAHADSGEV